MSTFTKELTDVNDKALEVVTNLHNAGLAEPITPHEYLSNILNSVLKSWQDQHIRIPASEFLLRFPAGKIDTIKAAAANNPVLAAYIDELRVEPFVYTGSDKVRNGVSLLVTAGILTQAQASVILS